MTSTPWKKNLDDAVRSEDWASLVQLASREPAKTLRHLTTRLCSADADFKWKAVHAMAVVTGDREGVSEDRVRELLRRFLWLLSDESGNVPYGVPEAFGEILATRPELQPEFLPLLCSLAYDPDCVQTGIIEQGVFWALGRVGQPAAACSPEAAEAIVRAAEQHPEPETRNIAIWARSRF